MTQYYPIDSNNATGVPYDFTVTNIPFMDVSREFQGSILQAIIPNARGTFQTNFNDLFSYICNGTSHTYTFSSNLWDGTTLASTLQSSIQTATGTSILVTWDATNFKFSFYLPAGVQFYLDSTDSRSDYCYEILGLTLLKDSYYLGELTLVGQVARLNGTKFVDVFLNCPTAGLHPLGYQGWVCRVPMNVAYGNDVLYEPFQVEVGFGINGGQLSNLRIFILDQWGKPYRIDSNQTVSYVLRLD